MNSEQTSAHMMNEYTKDPKCGFDLIYRTYADRLVQYAVHSFRLSCDDAEDAVHETFLPWVQNPAKMREVKNLRAYLFTSLRNASLKRTGTAQCSAMSESIVADKGPDLLLQADVAVALSKLPEEQRETVYLKIWGDLTFAEIAELQNISLQTAASRYRYSLAKLKEILQWNP